ncbi:24590_t:CDS:2 [Dentiscutata erythropus]|uniref:24590_t:CDS:1 n=1 Tax=Dentiscutata erythropus TaxID=1348616 RepID=A0A9N9IIM6_9GLOM|nr:24590_t:CDS:2 [Dentiscutata erythropus]
MAAKLRDTIIQLNKELRQLNASENRGMNTNADKYQQKYYKRYRSQQKQKLQQVERQCKEAGLNIQLTRPTIGCLHLEEMQLGLLEAILRIVSPDRQADERRHLETLQSVKTLDQLQEALEQINYKLSRSATYLRLIPKQHNTIERK